MINKLEHVGIVVKDMDTSLEFYQSVIGLELRERKFLTDEVELSFLAFPGQKDVEVELISGKAVSEEEGKVNHLAFSVDHLEKELDRLIGLGVKVTDQKPRSVFNGQMKIAFFEGPDGEKLELVER